MNKLRSQIWTTVFTAVYFNIADALPGKYLMFLCGSNFLFFSGSMRKRVIWSFLCLVCSSVRSELQMHIECIEREEYIFLNSFNFLNFFSPFSTLESQRRRLLTPVVPTPQCDIQLKVAGCWLSVCLRASMWRVSLQGKLDLLAVTSGHIIAPAAPPILYVLTHVQGVHIH